MSKKSTSKPLTAKALIDAMNKMVNTPPQVDTLLVNPDVYKGIAVQIEEEEKRRQQKERRIRAMSTVGAVIRQRNTLTEWEVIESKEEQVKNSIIFSNKKYITVNRIRIKSKNSGLRKWINPKLNDYKYDVVSVPDAAKILYGLEEDSEEIR